MNPAEILNQVRAQPFEPFRVHISDGSSYGVPHPDFIQVTRHAVVIAVMPGQDQVPEKSIRCDPIHITRLEPMATTRSK